MRRLAGMLMLAVLAVTSAATAQTDREAIDWTTRSALDDTFFVQPKRPLRAVGEVFGLNLLVWSYDRFVREGGENPVFRIGFNSWKENLQAGFTWDDNNFNTNQFAHPYHGSLYFNAARSNGYSFWESVPFAFGGSYLWEYFNEVHNASMNDWIATSVGGSAVGEILHRLATSVRDNRATGSSRTWREIAGFGIDPVGGLNRAIDGDMGRRHANPRDRHPGYYRVRWDVGLRTVSDDRLFDADTTKAYMKFDFDYGDPFFGDMGKPYQNFDLLLQLNFSDRSTIGRFESNGMLAGTMIKDAPEASHIVSAHLHHDFINTNQIEFGAQAFSAGLLSRFETRHGMTLQTRLHAGPILLGAVTSDHPSVSGRSYDYGPGVLATFSAAFGRDGWDYLYADHQQFWVHAISGNAADHFVSMTRLRLAMPAWRGIGLGGEYVLTLADRTYRDYPDVSVRLPQMRVFAKFVLD
jgi:hypothetical protein